MAKRLTLVFTLAIMFICGCQSTQKQNEQAEIQQPEADTNVEWISNYDMEETGALVEIEEDTIIIKRIDSGEKMEFTYKSATDVTDKYERLLTMNQLEIGELVNVYYNSEDQTARKVQKDPEAWEYTQISNLTYDRTESIITFLGTKYKYGASFTIISDGEEIDLLELSPIDEVTVKGYNKKICSVIVTTGHGYISLENDEDFWGGWIEVGTESAKPVTEGMTLTVSEGNHKISIANSGAGGTKSIAVKRNEETVVDVGDLKSEAAKSGSIKFNIKPENAMLFINGASANYSDLIVLDYGSYKIKVTADGYDDFSQVIVVGSTYVDLDIDLTGSKESDSSDSDNSKESDKSNDNTKKPDSSSSENTNEENPSNTNNADTENQNTNGKTVLDEETISQIIDELLKNTISTNLDANE